MSNPTIYAIYEDYVDGCIDNGELPASETVWTLWKAHEQRITALKAAQQTAEGDHK